MTKYTTEEAAAIEAELDREVAVRRMHLAKSLANAEGDIGIALAALAELRDDRLYDVELAETVEGDDLHEHMRNAARALRAAMAVLDKATGAGQ